MCSCIRPMSLCNSVMRCSSVARDRYAPCRGSCALWCTRRRLSRVDLPTRALRRDLARPWVLFVFLDPHTCNRHAVGPQDAPGYFALVGDVQPAARRVVGGVHLGLGLVPERVVRAVVGYHNLHSASLCKNANGGGSSLRF